MQCPKKFQKKIQQKIKQLKFRTEKCQQRLTFDFVSLHRQTTTTKISNYREKIKQK